MQILRLQCIKTSLLFPISSRIIWWDSPEKTFFLKNESINKTLQVWKWRYTEHSGGTETNEKWFTQTDKWPSKHGDLWTNDSSQSSCLSQALNGPQRPAAQTSFAALPGVWRRERAARPAAWMPLCVIRRKRRPEPRSASSPVPKTVSPQRGDRGAAALWWEEITGSFPLVIAFG